MRAADKQHFRNTQRRRLLLTPRPCTPHLQVSSSITGPYATDAAPSPIHRSTGPHSPARTAAPVSAAGAAGGGGALREVPESFWRVVAPDVHHEMLEYLYDQDPDPKSRVNAMIAAMRAKQGVEFWTGLSNAKKAEERKAEGSLGSAAGVAVVLGLMTPVPRYVCECACVYAGLHGCTHVERTSYSAAAQSAAYQRRTDMH